MIQSSMPKFTSIEVESIVYFKKKTHKLRKVIGDSMKELKKLWKRENPMRKIKNKIKEKKHK